MSEKVVESELRSKFKLSQKMNKIQSKSKKNQPKQSENFSDELDSWLKSKNKKTLMAMEEVFEDRTFALLFLILMATSALPVPTAGITDVFTVITILVALQIILGRTTLWLPKRWRGFKLSKTFVTKVLPKLVGFVRKLEKFSRPRFSNLFETRLGDIFVGLCVAVLAGATITAPPFSGLDTLPALGVVVIALGMILRDGAFLIGGIVIGALGVGVQVLLGKVIVEAAKGLF